MRAQRLSCGASGLRGIVLLPFMVAVVALRAAVGLGGSTPGVVGGFESYGGMDYAKLYCGGGKPRGNGINPGSVALFCSTRCNAGGTIGAVPAWGASRSSVGLNKTRRRQCPQGKQPRQR
jgi:hypothetical protein